jgi:hypothetical protein
MLLTEVSWVIIEQLPQLKYSTGMSKIFPEFVLFLNVSIGCKPVLTILSSRGGTIMFMQKESTSRKLPNMKHVRQITDMLR